MLTLLALVFSQATATPRIIGVSRTSNEIRLTIDHGDLIEHRTCHADLSNAVGALDPARPAGPQFAERIVRYLEIIADQPARVEHDRLGRVTSFAAEDGEGGDLSFHYDDEGRIVRVDAARSPGWPPQTVTDMAVVDRIVSLVAGRD